MVYLETEIVLTYKEFELLSYLVRNRGTAISRDRLLEQVWGFSYEGETRTVDAHVKTLRQKLDELFIEIFDAGADDNAFR